MLKKAPAESWFANFYFQDVLELLPSVQAVIVEYASTIHRWMPVVSQRNLLQVMEGTWETEPELALLLLCMHLITSRPQDGIESSQNPAYISAKRLISVMEASGMISLLVLQASLLVTFYEYGQSIYPAAWMSSGWCVRYGNMLGLHNFDAGGLLGRCVS